MAGRRIAGYAANSFLRLGPRIMAASDSAESSTTARTGWIGQRGGVLIAVLYIALHFVVTWGSYVRPQFSMGITPWSPQTGVLLAFLIFRGSRWIPVVIFATFISEWWVRGAPQGMLVLLMTALWVAGAYGSLAKVLTRLNLTGHLETAKQAIGFAAAIAVGTFVTAIVYVCAFLLSGKLATTEALPALARYWIGDLNGVLCVTPLLGFLRIGRFQLCSCASHRWEIVLQVAAVVGLLCLIFMLPAAAQLRFFYLLYLPIIWIALRWSWPSALSAVLIVQLTLLVAVETGFSTAPYIDIQFLLLTVTLTGLLLGAIVAERANILQHVRMREAEQRALLAMAPDAVLAVDTRGDVRVANAAATRMFGAQAATEHLALERLIPKISLEAAEGRATLEGRREDGSTFPAEVAWSRLDAPANEAYLVTVRDATDRRMAEEQIRERDAALARAMRFAVAGELASALAHELNQPITALVSYLRASEILAARSEGNDERLSTTLNKAASEAIRASEVLRQLRDFYQGGVQKLEDVNVSAVCGGVVNAFQERLRRHDVTLSLRLQPDLPNVQCDGTQLQIVLHNLITNALEAVMNGPAGRRRIYVSAAAIRESIAVSVEDSGPGVPATIAQQLFEPFTTNKPDGMGLGLAISRSLMRARGGELACVRSSSLGGAAFIITIPFAVPLDWSFG